MQDKDGWTTISTNKKNHKKKNVVVINTKNTPNENTKTTLNQNAKMSDLHDISTEHNNKFNILQSAHSDNCWKNFPKQKIFPAHTLHRTFTEHDKTFNFVTLPHGDNHTKNFLQQNDYRLMKEQDYTLTSEEEKKLVQNEHIIECCTCCSNPRKISEILGRNFYRCGICYCCMGDDLYGAICTIYVNDFTRTLYMVANENELREYEKISGKYFKKI